MRKTLGYALVCVLVLACLSANEARSEDGYFQQFVQYTIKVRLDPKNHKLHGTEAIVYKNNSPDTLRSFYLHLYPNAYKSKDTALMKDIRRSFNHTFFDLPEKYRGYLNIADVTIDGTPVTPKIDDTIAEMDLPAALLPGDSIEVSLSFEEKIRRHSGRAGYRGEHYDLAQWYPKVVVYDKDGFHPDKFQAGEFYGEFGVFDVYLEVPESYVVAATGVPVSGDPGWTLNPVDGSKREKRNKKGDEPYKTVHFRAEDVHDFAWNADPNFAVQDTTWNGIEIKSFFRKSNKAWKDTSLVHGLRATQWLSERVGLYPYPQVSIVDALLGGGMEYPMLVMDGSVSEGLVVHEVGHIYFFGILGNNERTEAWMDEGFTTFQTAWYLTEKYGEHGITRDWNWYQRLTPQFTVWENYRRRVFNIVRPGYGERIATRSEKFVNSYWEMVYRKAALMLRALRYVVGEEDFDKILKEYFEEWRFKHVDEERFQAVCERVSGMDLLWFFEEWLHTKKICDYRLAEVKTGTSESGGAYAVDIKIERKGEIVMPLELEITFDGGTVETVRLEGRLRTIKKSFEFPEKPRRVALNPGNEIMDINLSDNFLPRQRDLQIDWPNNHYYPEHAYQIRHHPFVWYNDIDQALVGLNLKGSYANWSRRLKLGGYYGTKSHRVDFLASYTTPMRVMGINSTFTISGYKLEGRNDFTMTLDLRKREELIRPPTHRLTVGVNYHELRNPRYVNNPLETYDTGSDIVPLEFRYAVDPQFDILRTRFDVGFRFGRKWFGGDYKYTNFTSSAVMTTRPSLVPFDAGFRVFLGLLGGSMPLQEKYNLAGAGPRGQETSFFLRSPGAVWPDLHYVMPGDGNLRGYAAGTFGVNQLFSLNFELGRSIPLLSKAPDKWLGTIKVMAFSDVGTVFDNDNPIGTSARVQQLVDNGILKKTLVDAGVGFRMTRNFPFYRLHLRFDIPFWVNVPEVNGESDETKYRYLLSLTSVF